MDLINLFLMQIIIIKNVYRERLEVRSMCGIKIRYKVKQYI